MATENELWTNVDIAAHLRISVRSVEAYESQGVIPPAYLNIPVGASGRIKKRWRRADVIEHLEQRFSVSTRLAMASG